MDARRSQFPLNRMKRKVKIYRNGDHISYPISYSYDSSIVNSFKELLLDVQDLPLFDDGIRITRMYTMDGRRIGSIRDFEDAGVTDFVATGPEGFMRIKGGYQSHAAYKEKHEENNNSVTDRFYYRKESTQHHQSGRSGDLVGTTRENQFAYPGIEKSSRNRSGRLHDRLDNGVVKKIYLYRSGDPYFKPKVYVYRSKIHRSWDKFLEGLDNLVPPIRGGRVRCLYTMKGKEVKSFDQLRHRRGYVAAGQDGFAEIKGGYQSIGRTDRSASSTPRLFSSPQSGLSSRPRTGSLPALRERLHERRLPEPTFFFVFKNGDGLSAKRFLFTAQQMERGMAWVLEQIARRFGINANKLVTMDNREITDPRQILNRGAYIIIAFGEKFKENWHHFPEMAVDTSIFTHREGYEVRQNYGSSDLRRYHSSLPPLSNREMEKHDTRDAYSDMEQFRGPDVEGYSQHRERSGSASSRCSLCELFEQHRRNHHSVPRDNVDDGTFLSNRTSKSSKSQGTVYSAEDMDDLLPPRPVTSRRVRLSPNEIPDDEYPTISSTLPNRSMDPPSEAVFLQDMNTVPRDADPERESDVAAMRSDR